MKRLLAIIILGGLMMGGCLKVERRAGIEVTSYPTAKILIDGREAGMTPYKNTNLSVKETEIKLVAGEKVWIKKIELKRNISTVIDWEFGKGNDDSGGYVLYMEKTGDRKRAGMMVNTTPNESTIVIDSEIKGFSPTRLADIGEGDRQVTISFPGYKSQQIFIKAIKGYQLIIESILAKEIAGIVSEPEEKSEEASAAAELAVFVKIRETETGWLRVRKEPSSSSLEIKKIKPGETYKLILEQNGWEKIEMDGGVQGWISSKYAEKL